METPPPDEPLALQATDRRQHPRVPVRFPIVAYRDDRQGRLVASNISIGGACCRSESRYPPQTRLRLHLDISGGRGERESEPFELEAVVVRCEPQPREQGVWDVAVSFQQPEPRTSQRLTRFIRAQQDS